MKNQLPNSQCLCLSPHQELFSQGPSITTLYPFGEEAIVHIPTSQKFHKLEQRVNACFLLKPLMTGGWLFWDPPSDRRLQSAAVFFLAFSCKESQPSTTQRAHCLTSSNQTSRSPSTWARPYQDMWKVELKQMMARHVWEAVDNDKTMKKIGHHANGSSEKLKACFVARGDHQRPGVDCTKTYAPAASLMSLFLLLAHSVCCHWPVASFDVRGAYLYSPVKETVFV
ncbi:hypothetical protein O181_037693 [Austropuccinia psidii MF-1]|uniref:Reverse transcriptase Ty1/copia-type domain-containing protein n=1 Tax=Austropuccinia psidii MF-1 TaxID=1389203 RepID=A0A9Q3HAC4_9BASI|nr:hypothetical protein [Austropuccinia psidii MF-1]